MKQQHFEVDQVADDIDINGLDAAMKIAQTKIKSLGLEQYEAVNFGFTIGNTSVSFFSETLAEPPSAETSEE